MNKDFLVWLPVISQVTTQIGIPIVLALISWAGMWLGKKLKSESLSTRIDAIAALAGTATAEVAQVYVDVAKTNNRWDDAAKQQAKSLAVAKLIELAQKQLGVKLDTGTAGSYIEETVRSL